MRFNSLVAGFVNHILAPVSIESNIKILCAVLANKKLMIGGAEAENMHTLCIHFLYTNLIIYSMVYHSDFVFRITKQCIMIGQCVKVSI